MSHLMSRRWAVSIGYTLCGLALLAGSHPARAALVTVEFSGFVSSIAGSLAPGLVEVGDFYTGTFTYENTASDNLGGTPNEGLYNQTRAGTSYTANFGDLQVSATSPTGFAGYQIEVRNVAAGLGFADSINVVSNSDLITTPDIGQTTGRIQLNLSDPTGAALHTDGLAPSIPAGFLEAFAARFFQVSFAGAGLGLTVRGTIETLGSSPGSGPNSPILPNDPFGGPGWSFPTNPGPARWYDPVMASGFAFETQGGTLFTEITPPDTIGDADGQFVVADPVNGSTVVLAGQTYVFPAAVGEFTITGINPTVDSDNPLAFPIALAFTDGNGTFTMTPIPEPSTFALALLACGALWRRRQGDLSF